MNNPLSVYVGYDPRESAAYRVCIDSMKHYQRGFSVQPISRRLADGMYTRPTTHRDGKLWDTISDAPMSTDFSLARFFIPALQPEGWALYCDCDFLWRAPIGRLLALADDRYAVMVVKHQYDEHATTKMDGQVQTAYARKNWSSLMLFNCSHPVFDGWETECNHSTGLYLHQFQWCTDEVIGSLPVEWNWLEGISLHVDDPQAVHFTRGTPDMPGYENSAYADEWRRYAQRQVTA
jgi:hypothetical protein